MTIEKELLRCDNSDCYRQESGYCEGIFWKSHCKTSKISEKPQIRQAKPSNPLNPFAPQPVIEKKRMHVKRCSVCNHLFRTTYRKGTLCRDHKHNKDVKNFVGPPIPWRGDNEVEI